MTFLILFSFFSVSPCLRESALSIGFRPDVFRQISEDGSVTRSIQEGHPRGVNIVAEGISRANSSMIPLSVWGKVEMTTCERPMDPASYEHRGWISAYRHVEMERIRSIRRLEGGAATSPR